MMFYSVEFILLFLPFTIVGYLFIERFVGKKYVATYLVCISLGYYSLWGWRFFLVLVSSLIINFIFYRILCATWIASKEGRLTAILFTAIVFNLAWLGYFKYYDFFLNDVLKHGNAGELSHSMFPIGISFYTFIQIGFLIEARNGLNQGRKRLPIINYLLLGSFFPYVTAGPLVLQQEILNQVNQDKISPFIERLVLGCSIFVIGLAKKLVIADALASHSSEVFAAAEFKESIGALSAWKGILSYTLQLYFDFSGYSDMALGLGIIFGILLPLNFNSPLKAVSIIEFWRRWHMTMSRFFTNYVYSPLAISLTRQSVYHEFSRSSRFLACLVLPTLLTFFVAGIWHGAGWGFMVFGLIHGLTLSLNHAYRTFGGWMMPRTVGWLLTMTVFMISLVFFRLPSLSDSLHFLKEMFSFSKDANVSLYEILWLGVAMAIVLFGPNTLQIFKDYKITSDEIVPPHSWIRINWRPSVVSTIVVAVFGFLALSLGVKETPFIYYKF